MFNRQVKVGIVSVLSRSEIVVFKPQTFYFCRVEEDRNEAIENTLDREGMDLWPGSLFVFLATS